MSLKERQCEALHLECASCADDDSSVTTHTRKHTLDTDQSPFHQVLIAACGTALQSLSLSHIVLFGSKQICKYKSIVTKQCFFFFVRKCVANYFDSCVQQSYASFIVELVYCIGRRITTFNCVCALYVSLPFS